MPEGAAGAIAIFSAVAWKLCQAEMKYWHFSLLLPVHLHEKPVLTTENWTLGQSFGGADPAAPPALDFCKSLLCTTAPCGGGNTGVPHFCSYSCHYTHTAWPARLQFLLSQHWERATHKLIWEKHEAGPHLSSLQWKTELIFWSTLPNSEAYKPSPACGLPVSVMKLSERAYEIIQEYLKWKQHEKDTCF